MERAGYTIGIINTTLARNPELIKPTIENLKRAIEEAAKDECVNIIQEGNKHAYGKKSKWDCDLWRNEPMFSDTCSKCGSRDVCEL